MSVQSGRSPIDSDHLRELVRDRWSVEVVDETDSTNRRLLESDRPDRSVLVAEYQTGGRGRLDRTWTSPPRAGLLFSVLLRPRVDRANWSWLPLLTGLAVRRALLGRAPADVALKWPNDVLLGRHEHKVAGILAEAALEHVVVGVGLNVDTTRAELPVETATSLVEAGGAAQDRTGLLAAILTELDDVLVRWASCDGDVVSTGLALDYAQACSTIGRDVVVTLADRRIVGRAIGVDPAGRLRVATDEGEASVGAGDVHQIRPTRQLGHEAP
ncbi:MAG: biotin--[acetyl-CoA-carboxylase] ligase [Actinobacteria bacterium]|nr:biotin--[acetyl-CoA-carboxylase] ligase [Actinomycetota bacterium]